MYSEFLISRLEASSIMKALYTTLLLFLSMNLQARDLLEDLDGVYFSCEKQVRCSINIIGPITKITATSFISILKQVRSSEPDTIIFLYLDSDGGDVSSAQKIGESIREDYNHAVFVSENKKCLSACVFILAGGAQRVIEGQVGIHRPYYPLVEDLSFEERAPRYNKLVEESRDYFGRMNIRREIVDAMISTPPEEMMILTRNELSYYGLNRNDPVFDEYKDDVIAKRFGLGKTEYLKKKQLVENVCARRTDYDECMSAILTN